MVRQTAAGTIVPIQFRAGKSVHRYWVTSADRDRLEDLESDDTRLPPECETTPAAGASRNRPHLSAGPRPVRRKGPAHPGCPSGGPSPSHGAAVAACRAGRRDHTPRP